MNSLDAHDVAARSAAQGSRLGSAAVEIAGVSGMNCDYSAFLRAKIKMANFSGFDVNASEINPHLKPHTRDIVRWALQGGRRAVFASFGLHKTATQLEIMRLIGVHAPCLRLITLPLGVRQEFRREVEQRFKDEYAVDLRFIRRDSEIGDERTVYMTNYEAIREGNIDPRQFGASSLDEASVLRSYGSKTFQEFLPLFEGVRFKFVNTATPSPNRFKELIHYAAYLGVMDSGQALTRFFQRDSEKAGNLTLYPHKEQEFWLWVASWAVFIHRPSDLGHSDDGYELPPLDVRYHEIDSDYSAAGTDRRGQGLLVPDVAMGLSAAAGEKRQSMNARVAKTAELVAAAPDDHFIVWHDLEDERHALQAAIPEAVSVWGSQDLEVREQRILDFSDGKFRVLSTKPIIAGSGCNLQRHCHREIFAGIGFKFNDFIQSLHRVQRFGQEHPVRIDIIHTESEREVLRTLMRKWDQHIEMGNKMTEIIKQFGLNQLAMQDVLARSIGTQRVEVKGDLFTVAKNDCVEEARLQPDSSVDLIVTSIPFANHYEYTPSYNDFGHTSDNDHFWQQMDFLTPELLRILKPGRIYCCHVKDRINFGNVTGAGVPTVSPFHAEALFHGLKHGFDYLGMITVVTDVVRENNQTYRLGYTEMCKDGTKMGVGSPEYVLLFHKPQSDRSRGYADLPVAKSKAEYSLAKWQVDAHAFWRSSGNRLISAEEMAALGPAKLATMFTQFSLENVYDYEFHVKIGEDLLERQALPSTFMSLAPGSTASQVWSDVNRMRTLNGDQTNRAVEKHVCPLQFDIVDRLIERYSNKGERVYDPFCGLGTVPYRAILKGRTGGGSELSAAYFMDQVHYLKAAERQVSMPDLFASLEVAA
jgi:DNA modification methylase